jgi:hypothetical protein
LSRYGRVDRPDSEAIHSRRVNWHTRGAVTVAGAASRSERLGANRPAELETRLQPQKPSGRSPDGIITMNAGLTYQQNLAQSPVAIVLLATPGNRLAALLPFVPDLLQQLAHVAPGQVLRVGRR